MERRTNRTPPRKPDSGAAEGLRSASGEVLGEARRQIDDPDLNDATAVHEFRKGMKRWRALLRLFEPLMGDEAAVLRVEARDLARELAGSRDARSAIDGLADLGEEQLPVSTRRTLDSRLEALGRHAAPCAGMDQQQRHGGADQERGCDPEGKLVPASNRTDV